MRIERTKNATRSIMTGLLLKLFQTVIPFLMRTAMIHLMGVEYLGLNGLFTSILHMLSLAELGVGAAMVFSMYKPIAEDDTQTICALMGLYRRYYRIIGLVIGVVGLVLTPVVPSLISGELPPGLNVYWLYLLNLGATVLTYWLFAYRNCLLQAYQRLDLSSWITIVSTAVQHILQLLVMIYLKNYYLYLIVKMATNVLNNVLTALVTKRKFPQYRPVGKLGRDAVDAINGKIRDIFTSKLGAVVSQYADTIVISAFLGLTILAVYQNYLFILTSVTAVIEILIGSITAGLGNSFITETREKNYRDLLKFTFLFLWLTGLCSCCFLGLYQPFMEIWVGQELMLDFGIVVCIAIYFLLYTFNRLLSIYKDAAGLWHQDRFRPLLTSMLNLALNLLSVKTFGLYGVILSTVLSMLLLGVPWQLHNLFTLAFQPREFKGFFALLAKYLAAMAAAGCLVCWICSQIHLEPWYQLMVCMAVSVLIPNAVFFLAFFRSKQFREALRFVDRLTKHKLHLERRLLPKEKTAA